MPKGDFLTKKDYKEVQKGLFTMFGIALFPLKLILKSGKKPKKRKKPKCVSQTKKIQKNVLPNPKKKNAFIIKRYLENYVDINKTKFKISPTIEKEKDFFVTNITSDTIDVEYCIFENYVYADARLKFANGKGIIFNFNNQEHFNATNSVINNNKKMINLSKKVLALAIAKYEKYTNKKYKYDNPNPI